MSPRGSGLPGNMVPSLRLARRSAARFHVAAANCTRMTIRQHGELFDHGAYAGCRDWDLEAGMSRAKIEI